MGAIMGTLGYMSLEQAPNSSEGGGHEHHAGDCGTPRAKRVSNLGEGLRFRFAMKSEALIEQSSNPYRCKNSSTLSGVIGDEKVTGPSGQ